MGRPRKPIEQKIREGNPGKRPLPAPLKLDSGAPVKPDSLPAAAAQLWDEIVPVLVHVGVAEQVDAPALTAFCIQWARLNTARRVVASEGFFAEGSTGQTIEHPALKIEREASALMLRFAEQFGLTPAARARIAYDATGARERLDREREQLLGGGAEDVDEPAEL